VTGVLVLAALGGGAWWWRHDAKHGGGVAVGATHDAQHGSEASASSPAGVPVTVEVVQPTKGGITRTSSQTGSVHAFESAELFAKISGYLKELSVDIGDHVKRGQVLAVIDSPEIIEEAERDAAALTQARAAVTQAEARVKTAEADLKAAEAGVAKSRADIERYTSTRKYREKELERFRGLFAKRAVPQQVIDEEEEHLDSAIAAEHSAQADVLTSQAKVVSAQAMVDQAKADLVESKARVEVASSDLDRARVMVEYTRIVSPYDGVVTFRGFHRGDFIRSAEAGAGRPILTVARADKVRVVTYVPDRDVPYTNVGDKANIVLDALPGRVFHGAVTRFAETEDVQSRTMRTEIDLENPKDELREGMYGIATLILDEASEHLTVPTSCLTGKTAQGEAAVYVVRDGRAHLTPVKVGVDDGLRVEVLAGLKPDDPVVLKPSLVGDGAPVTPSLSSPAAPAHAGA
jgi:RND family efflux transporter MFP subunit